MTRSNREPEAGEALVLVGYASLMESVQSFEWALKRLAIQKDETLSDLSFDQAWKRAEVILRRPIGGLEGKVPAEALAELPRLRELRNKLAHEILMLWRFETNLGLATHSEVVDSFVELSNEFDMYASQLDEVADEHLRELGVDPADIRPSAAEVRKILNHSAEVTD